MLALFAVARRLAIILHRIWTENTEYRWEVQVAWSNTFGFAHDARIDVPCRDGWTGNPVAGLNAALVVARKKDWDTSAPPPS